MWGNYEEDRNGDSRVPAETVQWKDSTQSAPRGEGYTGNFTASQQDSGKGDIFFFLIIYLF